MSASQLEIARQLPNVRLLAFGTESLLKVHRLETELSMTQTAVALERFRRVHNRYPSHLSELSPAFLPEPPVDWMCGKPLKYRVKPSGHFVLYSCGENGTDEQGSLLPCDSGSDPKYPWQAQDAIWPRPATNAPRVFQ
jgi:hypothetical protein